MTGALRFLLLHTMRNQWRTRITRLRSPRYAIAMALGLAYFWFIFFRPGAGLAHQQADTGIARFFGAGAPLAIMLYTAWTWIFGGDTTALAFTEAEVSMLFPAPLSRRTLIVYKLVKAQMPILVSAFFWVVILWRGMGTLSPLLRYAAVYVTFTTINLHRLGAALVRGNAAEHGMKGARRTLAAIGVFTFVLGSVAYALWTTRGAFAGGGKDGVNAMFEALRVPPASVALYPYAVAFAPMFAGTTAEWLRTIGPAVLLLVLHVWWVLRSESAFEESAVEASATLARRLAAMRTRQGGGTVPTAKGATRTLPLASTGAPAVAIVWKNVLMLWRLGALRGLLLPAALALVLQVGLRHQPEVRGPLVLSLGLMMVLMLLLFGPMMLRNDLRSDLLHLPWLKTLPLSGRQMVLAQVGSGAVPVAVSLSLTLFVALAGFMGTPASAKLSSGILVGGALAAPVVLLGLSGTTFVIHNAMALLFPGWIRLGAHGADGAGVEAMGMQMLSIAAVLVCLVVALILPAATGAWLFFAARSFGAPLVVATFVAGAGGGAVLLAQCYGLIGLLGGAFERVEPQQVA